jgi:hypothetical protein
MKEVNSSIQDGVVFGSEKLILSKMLIEVLHKRNANSHNIFLSFSQFLTILLSLLLSHREHLVVCVWWIITLVLQLLVFWLMRGSSSHDAELKVCDRKRGSPQNEERRN